MPLEMRRHSPLGTIRATPEVILWALAVFVCGVVVLPLVHLIGHRDDHVHGIRAHLEAHAAGEAHPHGPLHGEGDPAHFGLALLEAEAPVVAEPVEAGPRLSPRPMPERPQLASRWTPIRPGAP